MGLDFYKELPKGIYRIRPHVNYILAKGETLSDKTKEHYETDFKFLHANPEQGYIETPNEFFQRWINTRSSLKPKLHGSWCGGFELQLPQSKIEELEDKRIVGSLDGLVIASDFGYTDDFSGSLIFGMNDIHTEQSLFYHIKSGSLIKSNKIVEVPQGKKQLAQGDIYGWPGAPNQKYPFESLNSIKSSLSTYSLIGIEPDEVYEELRKIGFKW